MRGKTEKLNINLKKLRLKQGISQETLARQADLKLSNLAKLEGGFNSNPTLVTLIQLAKVLTRGSIDDLLANKGGNNKKVELFDIPNLGAKIKALRIEQGISQDELARQAELLLSNLSKLEGGFNSNPTMSTLQPIARVLTQGSINKLFAK